MQTISVQFWHRQPLGVGFQVEKRSDLWKRMWHCQLFYFWSDKTKYIFVKWNSNVCKKQRYSKLQHMSFWTSPVPIGKFSRVYKTERYTGINLWKLCHWITAQVPFNVTCESTGIFYSIPYLILFDIW